jgi:hypothetical protein
MLTKDAKFVIFILCRNDNQSVQRVKDGTIAGFIYDAKTASFVKVESIVENRRGLL